jgi:hypothetical protein
LPTQLPDLSNCCGQFFESRERSRLSSPFSLKQLEDVLREDWYNILLGTIYNLYESILRRIRAALQANDSPTPYS